MRRSRAATMVAISAVLAIAAAIAPSGAPGTRAASGTVTGFTLHDASRAVTLVEPSSTFGAPIWLDAGRTLQAAIMPPQNFGTNFVLRVGAASGQSLAVAAYPATHDPEVAGSPVAALETSLWCGPQDGSFTILELQTSGSAIIALAIRFDLGCDTSYARTGEYRYHSTIGYGGPSIAPLTLPLMAGGTTATATATYQNRGTLPIAISAVTIGGYDTFAFSIQADGCSGTAVAPGSSCAVSVDFEPPIDGGSYDADLTFTDDTPIGASGAAMWISSSTTTSLVIDPIAAVGEGTSPQVVAHVSPIANGVTSGSVRFFVDGAEANNAFTIDDTGRAISYLPTQMLTYGTHAITAHYSGTTNPWIVSDADAPAVQVDVRHWASVQFGPGSVGPTLEGGNLFFQAIFDSGVAPSPGTLRIRDATGNRILGSKAISSTHETLSIGPIALSVGTHDLRAEFVGDPTFVQASTAQSFTVTADTFVDANSFKVSATTFYPVVDGYRDTVTISGWCVETCTPTIKIYNSSNKVVRAITLPKVTGNPYHTTWNGRTSTGVLLPSGTYRVSQQIRDVKGNLLTKNFSLYLSKRTVRWINASVTKTGATYAVSTKGGTGSISKTSSFSGGLRISGGSSGSGHAAVGYALTAKTGLAYRGVKIEVLGKGTTSSSKAILGWSGQSLGGLIGPAYAWWYWNGSSSNIVSHVARAVVEADGPMSGSFDIAKVKLVYSYAVWAT